MKINLKKTLQFQGFTPPQKLVIKGVDRQSNIGLLAENTAFNGANCPGIILEQQDQESSLYILGILNSRLVSYYLTQICPPKLGGYSRFNANNINDIPVRTINLDSKAEISLLKEVVSLVQQMIALNKQVSEKSLTTQQEMQLQRQVEAKDGQIDKLVYKLYDLTEEEIKIVEGAE